MPVNIHDITEYGKYTYGTDRIYIWTTDGCPDKFITGKFCSLGHDIRCIMGNHDTSWVTTFPFGHEYKEIFPHHGEGHPLNKGNVTIGNDVWIGNFTTFVGGVKVGDGAVIAACSHVVKDVPPYTIVGGNPAKIIRKRFTDEQIEELLKIQWWNWDEDKIREAVPLLSSPDISEFIEKYRF
jgi:acetyltransferase-like isoleucine patch superfamily enzyme